MDYKSVNSKSLKFKGASTKAGGIKKKKKRNLDSNDSTRMSSSTEPSKLVESDPTTSDKDGSARPSIDTRTPAQRKFDEIRRIRQEKEIEKTASMSHRERIEAMNTHLSKLTDVNDLPKIGPG
ncbi:protein of unknown function [Taphrina deformans PYCC 5710]|uniref:DUF1754-domain-containing protein n=1 Tax=Taphrina deformans (strain PYCC 5710 / ATCC 11124 / CBS 356.35 / IMI 108563 / JCM 9778 / NBRC 8474) TaxID=1097556 RepID=R4X7W7_TAPDE|nr:protein of unknown function [Taphrina deformans PYCC 5710]|eukprot:CCG81322.1 protein of unknown function [Taphrina deformans PYCC 5710]